MDRAFMNTRKLLRQMYGMHGSLGTFLTLDNWRID